MTTPYIRAMTGHGPIRLSPPLPEPNAGRRPHKPETIEAARRLYTTTMLPLREVAARTGTSASTLSRRARWQGWNRPVAAISEERVTPTGRRALRRQAIAEALLRQAEHLAFQTEMDPRSSVPRLERIARLVRLSRRLDEEERTLSRRRKPGRKKPPKPIYETPLSAYGGPELPSAHR
jgi:hypothetical protein